MNLPDLVRSILILVIAGLLRLLFTFLGIDIPDEAFNTIVFGIVAWILKLIFEPVAFKMAFKVLSLFHR